MRSAIIRLRRLLKKWVKRWINRRIYGQLRRNLKSNIAHLERLKKEFAGNRQLIAIALIEHMGDIVACEPVARYARQQYPGDYIVWIVRDSYKELLINHPAIDEVVAVVDLTECIQLLEHSLFDRVIDLHVNLRECPDFGTIHVKKSGDTFVQIGNYYSHGSLLKAFAKSAGIPPLDEQPHLYLPGENTDLGGITIPSGAYIVIHAQSSTPNRDWLLCKWLKLVEQLLDGYTVQIVEVGLIPTISPSSPKIIDLCGKLTLAQLSEVIRRSSGFIGIDSGPAHLANAFRRPSVILLGHYLDYRHYLPYTGYLKDHEDEMVIHWHGPPADIPVEEVLGRAYRIFDLVTKQRDTKKTTNKLAHLDRFHIEIDTDGSE